MLCPSKKSDGNKTSNTVYHTLYLSKFFIINALDLDDHS